MAVQVSAILPGVALAALVAASAQLAHGMPALAMLSPLILAVVIGMAFTAAAPAVAGTHAGLMFCQKRLLRLAIVLLGFQVTTDQLSAIGLSGLSVAALSLASTFVFTLALGRVMGIDRRLAGLIAAGTSICGASAIAAASSVNRAREEDIAYAVAAITLFGTISMFAIPFLATAAGLDGHHLGLWAGSSIHEVAQAVGAAFQGGQEAGEVGTVAKLTRVALLAPVVLAVGWFARRNDGQESGAARMPIPWFLVAFIAVVAWNCTVGTSPQVKAIAAQATLLFLTLGLAAMGLQTNLGRLRTLGLKPAALALCASVFIACVSFALVMLIG
jgi:uncharacterized integral membrane protein (TIGR00698 family)